MRWLVHGDMPQQVIQSLRKHGHSVATVSELGLEACDQAELLRHASKKQLEIITSDADLAVAACRGPSGFARTIVLLKPDRFDDAVDRLFARYRRLSPGRLYTVTASRVKVRQLPGAK